MKKHHDQATIKLWLKRLFKHEGGYSRDPTDPGNWTGGRVGKGTNKGTKYGIASNSYGYLDIKNLTLDQAATIYRDDFLVPIQSGRYRDGVAFQLLDFAVNSGPNRAIKKLQKAVGVKADGRIGPISIRAIKALKEHQVIMLLNAERIEFMTRLRNWPQHGRGWMRRMATNLRFGAEDS